MERAEVLRILAEHRDELTALGVESLAVFGSVARDEAGPASDVDLLVDVRHPMGLFHFLSIQEYLENILGRPVDLVIRDDLKPRLRHRVLREAVPIPLGTPATQ